MKNPLRIAFMGTPEFAVASLRALLDAGYDVPVVVTAPDRPAGRGRKLQPPAVKVFALQQGIEVLQPERLKDPGFLEKLRESGINLQVVVAFRMLPREVWSLPHYGTFNLHASLLPDYRGAAPINWAVINGETRTGVTTFFIDEKIDTGKIILQRETEIDPGESAGELHDRLMHLGAGLVVETTDRIAGGTVETRVQKHLESAKQAPKLDRENCRLTWADPATRLYDKIRGLSPYPGAWTLLEHGDERNPVKLFKASVAEIDEGGDPGQIRIQGHRWFAATGDGWLEILEMQLPGKKRMAAREVLNGLELCSTSRFL
jgi:methionyl-tRNA formyltransferase